MKRSILLIFSFVLLIIPALLMAGPNAGAEFRVDIELSSPGNGTNDNVTHVEGLTSGDVFYVHCYCVGVSDLDEFDFIMNYDPSEINDGGYSPNNGFTESNILGSSLTSTGSAGSGYRDVAYTASGEQTDAEAPDGNGYLGYFTLQAAVDNPKGITFSSVQYVTNDSEGDYLTNYDHQATFGGGSLPVELSSFEAWLDAEQVTIKWTTQSEQNALGFNVLRSESQSDGYVKINSELINAAGTSTTQNTYEYRDSQLQTVESYWYMLEQVDTDGQTELFGPIEVMISTDVVDAQHAPEDYRLYSNFPNPFNPVTLIRYDLPLSGYTELTIFDMTGRKIKSLVSAHQSAGQHVVRWDATDQMNEPVSSGVYIYRLQAGKEIKSRKMMLLR
ncbi:MAG: T9SS type A sorting domain-containing protein [candidate division KSB1 bacterium]|nr:T9SS type A sorting domain-containing protein [candidate division KSB1 bacterium]